MIETSCIKFEVDQKSSHLFHENDIYQIDFTYLLVGVAFCIKFSGELTLGDLRVETGRKKLVRFFFSV